MGAPMRKVPGGYGRQTLNVNEIVRCRPFGPPSAVTSVGCPALLSAHAHGRAREAEDEVVRVLAALGRAVAHRVELLERPQAPAREERTLVAQALEEREGVAPVRLPVMAILALEHENRLVLAQQPLPAAEDVVLVTLDVDLDETDRRVRAEEIVQRRHADQVEDVRALDE